MGSSFLLTPFWVALTFFRNTTRA